MDYFYFGTIRKLVGGFGTIFSNINVRHKDENGITKIDFRVPLNYGPKNLWVEKLKQREREESNEARTAIKLPRMSFELGSFAYANDRSVTPQTSHKRLLTVDGEVKKRVLSQMQEIPYDFSFTLTLYAKNMDDGLQIIEQILPEFRPNFVITINEIPELNITKDVNVDLLGVTSSDSFEGSASNMKRVLTWEFTFTAKGYVFPPIKNSELIREVESAIFDFNTEEKSGDILTTVNPIDANEEDDWAIEINAAFPNE